MRTHLHGSKPPFRLQSNVVYFHDWRYVNHGGYRWDDAQGEEVPLWISEPVSGLRYDYIDMPLGIRLVAQRAELTEPVLTAEQANQLFLFGGNLIHEDGLYRLWYDCWPREDIGTDRMGNYNLVRYAESDNGMDWRLPHLGVVEYRGTTGNNVVYGGPLTPESGYHGGCVFVDPSGPPEERYKVFHLGTISQEGLRRYRIQWPDDIDPFRIEGDRVSALFGGVSPDGLQWTPLEEPLVVQYSDTHNVCTYDSASGRYLAYVRTWYMGRRTIGYTSSADFRHFPLPEELFWPDASCAPYELWYANGKTIMPGTTDYHVMFPMRWSLTDDRFDFHLATSPDGVVWGFVPGGPVCEPGQPGSWNGGVVAPGVGLAPLPGDRTGILVAGSPVPHKHPRRPPLGALAWAWWPRNRLVALEAETVGYFALFPLQFSGRTVRLNFRSSPAGYVKVEASGPNGQILPARSFNDCDVLSGDELDHLVTWRGETDLGHADGSPVTIRFRLRTAELFSVAFE